MSSKSEFELVLSLVHELNGRRVDVNMAVEMEKAPDEIKIIKERKIYVGGLGKRTTEGKINFILR